MCLQTALEDGETSEVVTVDGSLFQIRGAAEANERSPSVLRRVDGTTSDDVDATLWMCPIRHCSIVTQYGLR
jgi:hypothetical protein